jgi:hypothetical protein
MEWALFEDPNMIQESVTTRQSKVVGGKEMEDAPSEEIFLKES